MSCKVPDYNVHRDWLSEKVVQADEVPHTPIYIQIETRKLDRIMNTKIDMCRQNRSLSFDIS